MPIFQINELVRANSLDFSRQNKRGLLSMASAIYHRELAQLVERHPYKVDVAGSNPVLPTILLKSSDNLESQIGRVFLLCARA